VCLKLAVDDVTVKQREKELILKQKWSREAQQRMTLCGDEEEGAQSVSPVVLINSNSSPCWEE
jgi:hypothetical protein